ncbi:MAG: hypothetical protein COU66_01240 [Candidatus Pacebacteria bacterium CG10_big_fil_rev_8_21_14_0_10_44_11]|nr:MAG: hypothetical protein COU66_01240 [Candidatus Pacebacteria bacterium CG10_big_fil_rev_8_21_14_0_10_44_11]
MVNLNFAPNENFTDALKSLLILCQPQTWYRKKTIKKTQQKLAHLFQVKNGAVFLALSARGALRAVLKSLDLPQDSEVVVQAFICAAVVLPIKECRLKPRFVDIETTSFSFDLESLRKTISAKTKVIILQHSFGITPKNRSQVLSLAQKNNILVIEDLAHGFEPKIFQTDQDLPTIKLLSFGRSKALSCVHGGAVLIPQKDINQKFKTVFDNFSYPGRIFIFKSLLYKFTSPIIVATYRYGLGKVVHTLLIKLSCITRELSVTEKVGRYDYWLDKKLPAALANFLIPQLDQYEELVKRRQNVAKLYIEYLHSEKNRDVKQHLPIVRFPLLVKRRDDVMQKMKIAGFILGDWYTQPVAPNGVNLESLGFIKGSCPVAERVCTKIINLPLVLNTSQASELAKTLQGLL